MKNKLLLVIFLGAIVLGGLTFGHTALADSVTFQGFITSSGPATAGYYFSYSVNNGAQSVTPTKTVSVNGYQTVSESVTIPCGSTFQYQLFFWDTNSPQNVFNGGTQSSSTGSCQPNVSAPSVTSNAATNVTSSSATLNGFVNPNGNSLVSTWFEWGTNPNPPLGNTSSTVSLSSANSINFNLSNLSSNTTYYFRAAAQASGGTIVYGSIMSFTTSGTGTTNPPTVTTTAATNVGQSTATLNGSVSMNGNQSATTWFEWGTNVNPPLGNSTQTSSAGSNTTSISYTLAGLSPNTVYYFRAVIQSASGQISYGSVMSFTTTGTGGTNQPSVTTNSATNITTASATLNGFVNPNGNSLVSTWFEWGTNPNPPLGNTSSTVSLSSANSINFNLSNLSSNTTYYFRAAAQASGGTIVYGSIMSFTTSGTGTTGGVASVTTNSASNLSSYSVTLNGYVNPNGTTNTTAWFEWGTNSNPPLGNTTPTSNYGSSASNFSYTVNTSPNTTYYYRAVAQNQYGTVYGSILTFYTSGSGCTYGNCGYGNQPVVNTYSATVSGSNFAVLNGYVDPNGNQYTTRWFEWGTNQYSLGFTTNKLGQSYAGTFSDTVTNLSQNATYYFRAVAQNSSGTTYGQILSFTTGYGYNVYGGTTGTTYGYGNPLTSVVTTLPTEITRVSARVNGLILLENNNTAYTTGWFEWGTSNALGNTTSTKNVGSASSMIFNDYLYNISPNTIYYVRAAGQNAYGTYRGDIQSFQTLGATAANVVVAKPTVTYVSAPSTGTVAGVSTAKNALVNLTITSDLERVGKGDHIIFTVTYTNVSKEILKNIVLRVTLPKEYGFQDTSRGIYSANDNTVTVEIGTLEPGQTGTVVVKAVVNETPTPDKALVTIADLVYTRPSGAQEETIAYAVQHPINVSANAALALFGAGGFFPDTLLGWLLLIIILLILIILSRHLYGSYQEGKKAKEESGK